MLCFASCGGTGGGKNTEKQFKVSTIVCDDSFENIMSQEIDVYEYNYPKMLVVPYYTTQRNAIDSLLSLNTRTIVVPRMLTEQEVSRLKSHKKNVRQQRIAVDAIALIVNKENPIEILSTKELRDILSGQTTMWNDLEPSKLGKIQVVFDQNGSSTAQYMRDSILSGAPFGDNVYAQNSNPDVFKAVTERKNALGVIGVSWISADMGGVEISREERLKRVAADSLTTALEFNSAIKVLKVRNENSIRAYKPYQAYIYDGSYPLFRSIYMITTTVGGTPDNAFFAFVTGYQGQKVIQLTGVLPGVVQPRMVNLAE
jgi:phosphate transport system substrate-binding protein